MAVTGKRWKKNPTNYEKNKFLLGGNFRDPLNLNSLSDEKVIDIRIFLLRLIFLGKHRPIFFSCYLTTYGGSFLRK